MFSSLFKLASATVKSNVAFGGYRCFTRTNPVLRRRAGSNRPLQQNIEEVNDEYESKLFGYNEEREADYQSDQETVKPRYRRQHQQNIGDYERNGEQCQQSNLGINSRYSRKYKENITDDEEMIQDEEQIIELSPDEVIPVREELNMIPKVSKEQDVVSRKKKKKKEKEHDHDRTGIVEIGENIFKYQVLGRDAKELSKELMECKTSKQRKDNQKFMLEGKRLIYDAIAAKMMPLKIFFSRTEDLQKFKLPLNIELYKICYENLQLWSNVKTSQGIMAIFKLPSLESRKPSPDSLPLTIICDQVREPGNMGSIIRVAAGVGCSKLILTKGCVDVWEHKVLRSAAGAHFRIPIAKAESWDDIYTKLPDDFSLYLADSEMPLESDEESPEEVKSAGLAFKKKFMVSDNVPLGSYHSQNYWEKKSVVLVVGGETIGLSLDAYQLAIEKYGKRIFIPLSNGVESLNSGVALSVLSYEIRRQYLCEKNEAKQEQLSNSESYQAVGLYSE